MGRGLHKTSRKLSPDQRQEVCSLYISGESIRGLSKKFKINKSSVKGFLIARKISVRAYVIPPRTRIRKHPKSTVPVHERWATKQLELAIRRGDLIRPTICSECFKESKKINGHHDDYNFPLVVRWLCSKCHQDWHSKFIPIPSGHIL